jgi:class 3 adenylate cyclase/DNA-binding winged helix-turn-helix (wHTH) protein/tetratricopeptide (TPR) repeat protein
MRYLFGECEFDTERYELRRAGQVVALEPMAVQVLTYFVRHPGQAVAKSALLQEFWPGAAEESYKEYSLRNCLTKIRQAVGDTRTPRAVIETVQRYGYRFTAEVTVLPPPHPAGVGGPSTTDDTGSSSAESDVLPAALPAAVVQCPQCQTPTLAIRQFCTTCGEPLARMCPQCGTHNDLTARFCGRCGHALTAATATNPVDSPRTQAAAAASAPLLPEAERRQLTVLFCDLVDSTRLAQQLDPEDWRAVVQAYQETSATVIQRFEGYIAQYLGDGLLVYFGYPQAHEDDAQRAVHTGLGLVAALRPLNTTLVRDKGVHLAVRVGIHTGLVVVGEMGRSNRPERLALGATPHLAARLQGQAAPDTVVISAITYQLVQGLFTCQALDATTLKGLDQPLVVYQVLGASAVSSRFEAVVTTGLTPLVGREEELGLLHRRWAQVLEGHGQVVMLSGEAGIGKSRLVRELHEAIGRDGITRLTFRCSPYHQQSALYPVIAHIQRLVQVRQEDPPETQLARLEQALQRVRLPVAELLPLLAALLALPHPAGAPPLPHSPQRQKQQTQAALLAWLGAEAAQQPLLAVWEDLHWADPSTLEWLGLLLDQVPTMRLLTLMTCRPECVPPWASRAVLAQLTLTRLTRPQAEAIVRGMPGSQVLSAEVIRQIVARTDGVPLFVEELTKAVLETSEQTADADRPALTAPDVLRAIPVTLQDALRARLDRLTEGKAVAQLGAVLGRTFAYALLQAVAPLDEGALGRGLTQLVQAEILAQRGEPPQATYTFKHALIQDTAYQSLLKSTRQQYHQCIAQVLEAQFPDTMEVQPELLAHHYTQAGLPEQAIPYWQRAGQHASNRSAYAEAVAHLTRGLAVLATLPDTPEHVHQELVLQTTLGPALIATQGQAAPAVAQTYARARALCAQVGDTPHLVPILRGLRAFYLNRGELRTARELGEQLYGWAQQAAVPTHLLTAHTVLGQTLVLLGDYATAWAHLEQGIARIDLAAERTLVRDQGSAPGVMCLAWAAMALWCLGFPAQAVRRGQEALTLGQELGHPLSLAMAQWWVALMYRRRREASVVQALSESVLTLATVEGFPMYMNIGMCLRGWALAMQGQGEVGLAQLRQGLAAVVAMGHEVWRPFGLPLLAEAAGHLGQVEEGLRLLAEALPALEANAQGDSLAEVYRLQGELFWRQATPDVAQAEACLQQALAVARHQQAKSWELRAAMSLSRLWQCQGKRDQARVLLAPIYGWFSEGFDTADLLDARALLEALS